MARLAPSGCEKKAASTAISLINRYTDNFELLNKMSRLAREEMRHFEQVIAIIKRRGIEYTYVSASRYAAGLRELARKDDPGKLIDVLVIGAGPAGLMAALKAAKSGADVILADEDSVMGGRLNSETFEVDGQTGADWAAGIVEQMREMDNVRLMTRTTVSGVYDQGTFGALERVNHHTSVRDGKAPLETFWRIVAKQSILAAGAIERPIAFQNNLHLIHI